MAFNLRSAVAGAGEWASGVGADIGSWASGIAQQGASWIAGKAKDAIGGLISSVNKVMPNMLPTATAALAEVQFRGSQGNFATTLYPIVLKCEFLRTSDPLPERYGYPCNEFRALGGVSGFVLCKDAQVRISGTIDEEEVIEAFLNQGAFMDWTNVPIP